MKEWKRKRKWKCTHNRCEWTLETMITKHQSRTRLARLALLLLQYHIACALTHFYKHISIEINNISNRLYSNYKRVKKSNWINSKWNQNKKNQTVSFYIFFFFRFWYYFVCEQIFFKIKYVVNEFVNYYFF